MPKLSKGELAAEKWGGSGRCNADHLRISRLRASRRELVPERFAADIQSQLRNSPAGAWIESAIRNGVSEIESKRAGRLAVLAKLAETLFVETLCRYMDELPSERTGWLATARDPKVGQALALLHRHPARAWTLPDLARESGTSRTVLAERFVQLMGESPLAYLARWRLQLAERRLMTTDRKVLQVAYDVGYESEAAFSRAFRRAFGMPPARYRRERKAQLTAPEARL